MRTYHKYQRIFSLFLALVMIFSMIPSVTYASETGTIAGDEQTFTLGTNAATVRENNFNKGWKFYLGTNSSAQNQNFDDSSWKNVDLPHDFSITQNFTTSGEAESGFLPGGTGWYRKTFTMPAETAGKTILLNFDGVYSEAYVYVNGTSVGEHHYGYTGFAFDITDYLVCDGATENVVAVKAVNQIPSSRWYSGSGIYRDVTLLVMDPVHVDLYGTHVTTPNISSGDGTVKVEVDVVNDGSDPAGVTVTNTIYKKGSESSVAYACTNVTVSAGSTATASTSAVVSNPALWSVENPNLYTVVTELSVDGTVVDTYESTFGFRWITFDGQGFHLNGQNVKLNGVCMHHDQGALGSAAYYDAIYRQMSILKDMGANAIRTAHNPADEQLIEICNELGLLVIEEAFDGLNEAKNGNSYDFARYYEAPVDTKLYGAASGMTCSEYAARSMVKRDRNAPAIFAWSFGNEVQEGTYWNTVSQFAGFCEEFIEWVKDEDGTRVVTSGDNNRGGDSRLVNVINTITNAGGVAGFNYANDLSTVSRLLSNYGGSYNCIILSETSSHVNSRGEYTSQTSRGNADGAYHITSYDTSAVSWGITAHDSIYNTYQYDGVAGEFVWTGFDYIGEPTPWNGTGTGSVSGSGAIPNSSYFGIVDTAGFEKDSYYLYRSQWNKDETTLHLVTAWDSDNMLTSGSKTPVWVYSNAPVVKLYRDGTLVGTATRQDNTSSAGHTYYTYTTTSNSSSICTTSSGSGADGLYAVFNVAFTSGTLSAKAFEADGTTEITLTGNSGRNTVTTPDSVSQLVVSQNKTVIDADGSSLVYISVDVTDANGNLDTTASNTINFSLSGNGEIVGVDNGDQATTAKYQQSSVLTSSTSANIAVYAGKALVIVKSTEDAGSFTVNVSSSGLTGDSATVTTKAVADTAVQAGLVSYTIVKDYTVKAGTVPALNTTSTGTMADGSTVTGTIVWEEISSEVYNTAGDYTVNGTLNFADEEPIAVAARLHVIAKVVAMRNVSTVTTPGSVPSLPSTVMGILHDGNPAGEFAVVWESVSADMLATVGDVIIVNGTATVIGTETMGVTCAIRVGEAVNTESANVAPQASELTQDIAANKQSDVLESIINGTTKPGDNTSERWTNWNNRTTSAEATLTFHWATAQMLNNVNLYYYYDNCCAYPESIVFKYSLDGATFNNIGHTVEQVETYSLGAQYCYTFDNVINPVALQIVFTQQNGTSGNNCVGITEAEIYTFAGKLESNSSADLSAILIDGTEVESFSADTLDYEFTGTAVTAIGYENAAVTILPASNNVVRIVTLSEDGTVTKTYSVTLTADDSCKHETTEIRNAKDASCTEAGYSGDAYCTVCSELVQQGSTIATTAHITEIRDAKNATCTEEGYSGDTWCTVCNQMVAEGTVIAKNAHVTEICNAKAATCTETGYTGDVYCTVCGELVEAGSTIATVAHTAEIRNGKAATCAETGYTGDTYCAVCDALIAAGSEIPATGIHTWDNGVVTEEATETTTGVKTYTCTICKNTKTEEIPVLDKQLKAPTVSLSVKGESNKLVMTAMVNDYENLGDYYEITSHGILYIYSSRLGTRALTVNTSGRTKVNFSTYKDDGSYIYRLTPRSKTQTYAVRAYLSYIDPDTNQTVYVYSNTVKGSYNTLK